MTKWHDASLPKLAVKRKRKSLSIQFWTTGRFYLGKLVRNTLPYTTNPCSTCYYILNVKKGITGSLGITTHYGIHVYTACALTGLHCIWK